MNLFKLISASALAATLAACAPFHSPSSVEGEIEHILVASLDKTEEEMASDQELLDSILAADATWIKDEVTFTIKKPITQATFFVDLSSNENILSEDGYTQMARIDTLKVPFNPKTVEVKVISPNKALVFRVTETSTVEATKGLFRRTFDKIRGKDTDSLENEEAYQAEAYLVFEAKDEGLVEIKHNLMNLEELREKNEKDRTEKLNRAGMIRK